ncbi:DUF2171 domain-containing protein [Pseudoroseomonas wenyumeiae]|uniref:DUF2171 domain-containing protein n=1 Tax=Teichococcus wenyumeiae TaxID=2478470 RepID=A0A3A9JH03_9PROT|nr:DUF2171 domain-containing protein [Pseudoroseomonas wenyumeiae]RKK05842.1 DUF2171 domain-containing protein [Pseudoroseomonas wenyumeiae]RMI25676.1 DUF2171 domain-containing protein [Pseudoroseomonas wenyumeiae]
MVNPAHIEKGQIQDHMPVVGSDGKHFGTVDHLAGDYIKLNRSDIGTGGLHCYLPLSAVVGLQGGVVRLSMPAMQVKQACMTEEEVLKRSSMAPDEGARLGRKHDDAPRGSREGA